jgi:hypothetical protein
MIAVPTTRSGLIVVRGRTPAVPLFVTRKTGTRKTA